MSSIHVTSEIGKLKKVLLHRPGNELLNLTPDTLGELLFDDIPFLPDAQKEHDAFAKALRDNGVEVVYLEDLVSEVIALRRKKEIRKADNEELFFKLVRDSFKFKRKNIRNNLKNYDLKIIEEVLKKHNKDLTSRAEELELDIFIDLANALEK